jgi:acetyl esterase/lipase
MGKTGHMPRNFLIASVVGLLFVANARRAARFPLVVLPAFLASWLVIELAPHLLVLHAVGVALFVVAGALSAWIGWVALALSALSAVLLWGLVREAYRVHEILNDALDPAIGSAAAHAPVTWKEFALPFKLWSRKIRRVRDIPYVERGRRRRRLDIWYPRDEGQDRPCFLYVPGGAWMVGVSNKNQQGKPLLIEMASRDWVCFAMNYPVSPRSAFPAHIIAVKQAIAWIHANAHNYGGDARFLMIGGNSAGGHLSALAALSPNDPTYQPGFEDADTSRCTASTTSPARCSMSSRAARAVTR